MPLYEYQCAKHGTFEQLGSLAQRSAAEPCPTCQRKAPRILSAPQRSVLAPATRKAHERNEASAHEPRVVRSQPAEAPTQRRMSASNAPPKPHRHGRTASRPWMIGH